MSKINVQLTVTPAAGQGSKQDLNIEVDATGVKLRDIVTKAGVDPAKFQFTVDGKPASLDTYVGAGANVKADAIKVQATERAAGS